MKTSKLKVEKVELDIDKLPKELYQAILKEIMEEIDIYFRPDGVLIPMVDWDALEKVPNKKPLNLKNIIKDEAKLNPESIDAYIELFKQCVDILEKRKKKQKK